MKSSTIRRSNLSKEKMAVLEALKKYKNDESDYAPNVYIRPAEIHNEKKHIGYLHSVGTGFTGIGQ